MSKKVSNQVDLKPLFDEIGSSQIEIEDMLNPRTFNLSQHPLSDMVRRGLEEYQEKHGLEEDYVGAFDQFLADCAAVEKVRNLTNMTADQKLVDLGMISAARRTKDKQLKKRKQ